MSSSSEPSRGVDLGDVRVLDLSRVLAGPFATQVLAGLGADVVKVEFPAGDPSRHIGPFLGTRSLYYSSVNTGKRGIVLDPRTDDGRRTMHELIGWADVVVHNFRSDAAGALGLTPSRLLDEYPQLVVVTVTGYSSESSEADRASYDLTIQAESGFMAVTGDPGGAPVRSGIPISDLVAGLWAALAVTSSLLTARRTGRGVHVEVPLLDASLPMLSYMATSALGTGEEPGPVGSGHHQLVPYRAYATRDDHVVIAVLADKFWLPLCEALGLTTLADRPDLRTVEGRRAERGTIDEAVATACGRRSSTEVLADLERHGVPAARVNSVGGALTSDYAVERRRVATVASPEGEYAVVRGPFDSVDREQLPAPALGRDTDAVLAELRQTPRRRP